jgi:hypothetical protein
LAFPKLFVLSSRGCDREAAEVRQTLHNGGHSASIQLLLLNPKAADSGVAAGQLFRQLAAFFVELLLVRPIQVEVEVK